METSPSAMRGGSALFSEENTRSPNVNVTLDDRAAVADLGEPAKKASSSFVPSFLRRGPKPAPAAAAKPTVAAKSSEEGGADMLTAFSSEDAIEEDDVEDMDDMSALGFHTLCSIFGGVSMLSTAAVEADAATAPKQDFGGDANRLRKKLRDRERGLINPRSGKMQYWDLIASLSLLFVVFVTPFEVAFVEDTEVNLLFALNQIVNIVFISDIVITFMLPVTGQDGRVLKSHKEITKHYLKTWFFIGRCLSPRLLPSSPPFVAASPPLLSLRLHHRLPL